ncbi:MAG TPA: hypothetical protein VJ851_00835 [Jatrophihabitans sp.]|nr:hypothetical protein [Jatrophihabitans sp.]
MASRKQATEVRLHCWNGRDEPMAIQRGGPGDRWVYYDADLTQRKVAAERMGHHFDYRRTEERVPHPNHPEFLCQVWQYVERSRGAQRVRELLTAGAR